MGMLFKLAFRNIFRYKRRTLITFFAIALGLGLMVTGMCLYNGIDVWNRFLSFRHINWMTCRDEITPEGSPPGACTHIPESQKFSKPGRVFFINLNLLALSGVITHVI